MSNDWFAPELQDYFAASPSSSFLELPIVRHNGSHPLSPAANETIDRVPLRELESVLGAGSSDILATATIGLSELASMESKLAGLVYPALREVAA